MCHVSAVLQYDDVCCTAPYWQYTSSEFAAKAVQKVRSVVLPYMLMIYQEYRRFFVSDVRVARKIWRLRTVNLLGPLVKGTMFVDTNDFWKFYCIRDGYIDLVQSEIVTYVNVRS